MNAAFDLPKPEPLPDDQCLNDQPVVRSPSLLSKNALHHLPDTFRYVHERFISVRPSSNSFAVLGKSQELGKRRVLPKAATEDDWNDDSLLLGVTLHRILKLHIVAVG